MRQCRYRLIFLLLFRMAQLANKRDYFFKKFFFDESGYVPIKCKLLGESLTDDGSFVFVLKKEPPL